MLHFSSCLTSTIIASTEASSTDERGVCAADVYVRNTQVMDQLERMFGTDARSALTFSTHRWGEQVLTSGNGGSSGGGHGDMGNYKLRIPFVSKHYTRFFCTSRQHASMNIDRL